MNKLGGRRGTSAVYEFARLNDKWLPFESTAEIICPTERPKTMRLY